MKVIQRESDEKSFAEKYVRPIVTVIILVLLLAGVGYGLIQSLMLLFI